MPILITKKKKKDCYCLTEGKTPVGGKPVAVKLLSSQPPDTGSFYCCCQESKLLFGRFTEYGLYYFDSESSSIWSKLR